MSIEKTIVSRCALVLPIFPGFLVQSALADPGVLDQFVGVWDVYAETLQPKPSSTTYSEKYERTLDGKYIRGQTGAKADGTWDIVFGTYDQKADGYPFWIFSSSGSYTYLAPASWNERTHKMEWKSPPGWDISYRSTCEFPSRDLRKCSLLMKDWKGTVLLEMNWRAVRRTE